ncbi:MAG TPA: hypothetical protein IAB17_00580 [Candidatus Alectryocaccobium stercorigallinarum]|jgi:hypothetical protein|nr:hypothetical protein [Candidatus Alectryocaccobium stercorigallinarum]
MEDNKNIRTDKKKKSPNKNFYLVLGIIGVAMALIAKYALDTSTEKTLSAVLIGIGTGLMGFGIAKWLVALWGERNPELMRASEIEMKDERNQMIRNKAQAVSGEILHWLMIAGAWVGILTDASVWMILLFVGLFILKTILDFAFMVRYQKKM